MTKNLFNRKIYIICIGVDLSKDVTVRMLVYERTKRGGERILIRMRLFSDAVDEGGEMC